MQANKEFEKINLSSLPKGWINPKIGTLTNVISGGTPSTRVSKYWNGNIRWMNSGELNLKKIYEVENRITKDGMENSNTSLIPEKCVLVGLAGQGKTRGTVAMNFVPLCTNQSIAAILPCEEVTADFLYFSLDSRYNELRALSTGDGGRGGLNLTIIKNLRIWVPSNKREQTAIATALCDADALISSLEKLIVKKRDIKQGVMQKLLQPKEGWETKTLKEVARYRRGSFPQPYGLDKWYDDTNGMPFVQVFDVDDSMKLKSETKWRISKEAQRLSVFIKEGTLILTIQGSIGRIALTQYDAYVDRTLLIFESFIIPMNKHFFMFSVYVLFEREKQKAPGGTIKTITKEALSNFNVSYPNIEEQDRISSILSDIDFEIIALEVRLQKQKRMKQGMMQQLLTGKIRLVN